MEPAAAQRVNEEMLLSLLRVAPGGAAATSVPWTLRTEEAPGVDHADRSRNYRMTMGMRGSGRVPLLHAACAAGHARVVAELLDKGCSATADAGDGRGHPVHFAAACGRADVVELLLQRGASATARVCSYGSESPLQLAACCASADDAVATARVLLQHGACPLSDYDPTGHAMNAFQWALEHGAPGVATYLVREVSPAKAVAAFTTEGGLGALIKHGDAALLSDVVDRFGIGADAFRSALCGCGVSRLRALTRIGDVSTAQWLFDRYGAELFDGEATGAMAGRFLKLLALAADAELVPRVVGCVDVDAQMPGILSSRATSALATLTSDFRGDDADAARCAAALIAAGAAAPADPPGSPGPLLAAALRAPPQPPVLFLCGGAELRDPDARLCDAGVSAEVVLEAASAYDGHGHAPARDGPLRVYVCDSAGGARVPVDVAVDATVGALAARVAALRGVGTGGEQQRPPPLPQPQPPQPPQPPPQQPPAVPPAPAAAISAEQVGRITAMGFTEQRARACLEATGGDMQRALNMLLE